MREAVIYCSVDEEFARPLLAEFEMKNGMTVHAVYDTEAGKTTGLVERLRAERKRPRADVFWSSEVFGTIELAAHGILSPYSPPSASDIPAQYRDPRQRWTAFALRGRVLAYDPKRAPTNAAPRRWADLADARYKGRLVMANPQFGTTRGHMAVLCSVWGETVFKNWLEGLRRNGIRLADGNSQSAMMIVRGQADFGITDTDDVRAAQQRGASIDIIYPNLDSQDGRVILPGTLWIPNSAALVAGGPDADAGRKLLDFICSPLVEERLAISESGNVPVRPALRERLKIAAPAGAVIDYTAAAAVMRKSDDLSREVLSR